MATTSQCIWAQGCTRASVGSQKSAEGEILRTGYLEGCNNKCQPFVLGSSPERGYCLREVVRVQEDLAHQYPRNSGSTSGSRAWMFSLQGCPVSIQSDIATAVAYIHHQGGTRSRTAQNEVNRVLAWAERHVPSLFAVFIPGIEKWQADFLSHQQLFLGEWSLPPNIFLAICQRWVTPHMNLLASRFNRKVDKFVSRAMDPLSSGTDALVVPWEQFSLIHAFPPDSAVSSAS